MLFLGPLARVLPLRDVSQHRSLRESSIRLSSHRPRPEQPTLSDDGFDALAPNYFESLGIRELAVGAPLAAVPDGPQEELVVCCAQLLVMVTARGSRHAAVQ